MNVWHKPYPYFRSDDVIFKRYECEWILPLATAKFLKYNQQQLPAVVYSVKWWSDIRGNYTHIIQHMRSDYPYNRRVFAAYKEKEYVYSTDIDCVSISHSFTYLSSNRSDYVGL